MVDVPTEVPRAKIRVVSREKNERVPHIVNLGKTAGNKAFYRMLPMYRMAAVGEIKPFQSLAKYKVRLFSGAAKILQVSIHDRGIPVLKHTVESCPSLLHAGLHSLRFFAMPRACEYALVPS